MSIYALLKAKKANVGETRNRKGGMYKKISPTKWVQVKEAKGGRMIQKEHYTRRKKPVLKKVDTAVKRLLKRGAMETKDAKIIANNPPQEGLKKKAGKLARQLSGAWKKYKTTIRSKHKGEASKHAITKISKKIMSISAKLKDLDEQPITVSESELKEMMGDKKKKTSSSSKKVKTFKGDKARAKYEAEREKKQRKQAKKKSPKQLTPKQIDSLLKETKESKKAKEKLDKETERKFAKHFGKEEWEERKKISKKISAMGMDYKPEEIPDEALGDPYFQDEDNPIAQEYWETIGV